MTKSMTAPDVYHVDTNAKYLGQHVLAEFFECDPNILNNSQKVESLMIDAALECHARRDAPFHREVPLGSWRP